MKQTIGEHVPLARRAQYLEDRERVIFTGSVILQEQCLKVRELDGFPFTATIEAIKPKGFKFT